MNIVHVVPSYWPAVRYGGPIFSVHGLCRALARKHEVTVLTTDRDGPDRLDVPDGDVVDVEGVAVRYFRTSAMRRLFHAPGLARALPEALAQADILHTHSVFLWPTTVAARAAAARDVPYVVSPRGMLVADLINRRSRLVKKLWLALIERRNLEQAAALHFTSELERAEARKLGFGTSNDFVVPNGVDLEDTNCEEYKLAEARLRERHYGRYLLHLGRLNWKKGLDKLITALAEVPEVNLLLAGQDDGDQQRLESLAIQAGIADRVHCIGPVYGMDKAALMAKAAVFVLPSVSENFGNAAVEAMGYGAPVVVSREVGIANDVEAHGAGLVSDVDPDALAAAIRRVLGDGDGAQHMGRRGVALVNERFTWPAVIEQFEVHYETLQDASIPAQLSRTTLNNSIAHVDQP